MKIILLSGGSGKRLWPLSNDVRSKQFLRLLPTESGKFESMIQRVVRQIKESGMADSITIATGISQMDSIMSQLGKSVDVVTEPSRRDTFPAIALATAYLKSKGTSDSEPVVVMPCDVFTEAGYFSTIAKMAQLAIEGSADLVLMGIEPTMPSTKFGYIVPKEMIYDDSYLVKEFTEKPNKDKAQKLIAANAFWNGGVFAFKLGYLINIIKSYSDNINFDFLREHFDLLPKISFDYEVAEKAQSVAVVPFSGQWKDLGTWDALSEELPKSAIGNVKLDDNVHRTTVVNELDIPIVCTGISDVVVAASPDGILIADKENCDGIKNLVNDIGKRPMAEERRWGWYKVIGQTEYPDGHQSLTKLIHLNPNCAISYQTHENRDEIWTFVDGEGILVIDDKVKNVRRGDIAHILRGQKHTIKAISPLEFIEVQTGNPLIEQDIMRYDWDW